MSAFTRPYARAFVEAAPKGYDFNASNIGGSLYRLRGDTPGKPEHLAELGRG